MSNFLSNLEQFQFLAKYSSDQYKYTKLTLHYIIR